MREFTQLEDELFTLLDKNNIDEDLCDTCLDAFSTDEAMQKAINWLKDNPDFNNLAVSRIIAQFGIDSEDFCRQVEFDDEDDEE